MNALHIINTDATINVTETIEILCEQQNIVHGLVREFPTMYQDKWGTKHTVDFITQWYLGLQNNGLNNFHQYLAV